MLNLGVPMSTIGKNNKEYLLYLNTCTQSWLTKFEQSTLVVQINDSVQDSLWTPKFAIDLDTQIIFAYLFFFCM